MISGGCCSVSPLETLIVDGWRQKRNRITVDDSSRATVQRMMMRKLLLSKLYFLAVLAAAALRPSPALATANGVNVKTAGKVAGGSG